MNKRLFSLAITVLAGSLIVGCGEEGRKTVSEEDICAAYKSQLEALVNDTTKSEQDKLNQLPFLSGYKTCAEKVGTGGLQPAASSAPSGAGANSADAEMRAKSAATSR